MRQKHGRLIAAGGALAALALLYWLSPGFRGLVRQAVDLLARADIAQTRDYLRGFGVWAPLISALLMVLQALLLPLPSMALTLANGLVFGTVWGALLSWSSAMVAAVVCYYLARWFGRPLAAKLVGENALTMTDRFFQRYGKHAVLLARLIPGISFDVVSYAAGLSSIPLGAFVLATGLGQLPATVVYSFLGENLSQDATVVLWIIFGVLTLVMLGWMLKSYFAQDLSGFKKPDRSIEEE